MAVSYRMCSIPNQSNTPLNNIRIRLMNPQPPRPHLNPNSKVSLDLLIKFRIRRKQFLHRQIGTSPRLIRIVAFLAGEETVVGEEFAAVAG